METSTANATSTARSIALNPSVWFFAGQLDATTQVRHVPIHSVPFRIGRRSDLSLSLPCDSVSKEHAEIFERDGALYVRDLNSTNGTYVNGERVEEATVISEGDLVQFATMVFRVGREEKDTEGFTIQEDACDRALAMMQFDRLINNGGVVPFYQPIIDMKSLEVVGFEVLGRSRLFGLRTPAEMFTAASQLNLEAELSIAFRQRGVERASVLPSNMNLFVNTHPVELAGDDLIESLHAMRESAPEQAITLEIHEAAITDVGTIHRLREALKELSVGLAFDDFGAGQARLVELAEIVPDVIKFDMQLVQDIHLAPQGRQQVVASLVRMVNDLGITPLAEGVECEECHEVLLDIGFQMGQGFHYGHPASMSNWVPDVKGN